MCGRDQIWRKCTGTDPYAFSEWEMPVPAEVNWRDPRLRISVLPMESLLWRIEYVVGIEGEAYCSSWPETT